MSNDNYPAGVTDAHPYFNPQEGSVHVVCGNDEAYVVPATAVADALETIREKLNALSRSGWAISNKDARALNEEMCVLQESIEGWKQETGYECPFEGVMDVAISEEAEWTCPVCGATRTSDTLPEERDPDEGWDSRYDD